jgi:hypothetical protein
VAGRAAGSVLRRFPLRPRDGFFHRYARVWTPARRSLSSGPGSASCRNTDGQTRRGRPDPDPDSAHTGSWSWGWHGRGPSRPPSLQARRAVKGQTQTQTHWTRTWAEITLGPQPTVGQKLAESTSSLAPIDDHCQTRRGKPHPRYRVPVTSHDRDTFQHGACGMHRPITTVTVIGGA